MKNIRLSLLIVSLSLFVVSFSQSKKESIITSNDTNSVYVPVLYASNAKILNWAINLSETSVDGTRYAFNKLLLNSILTKFSLIVPTDESFNYYIDPVAYGQDVQGVLKFWFNTTTKNVNATIYRYNKTTKIVGDSVGVITSSAFLKNRLWDLLQNHIVIGNIENNNSYHITKGNDVIKVKKNAATFSIQGGNDILNDTNCLVTQTFSQQNGSTYFVDKIVQPTLESVYSVLYNKSEFSEFFKLLTNIPDTAKTKIFIQQGTNMAVSFFSSYHYTVFVPTNEAILDAINSGKVIVWDSINKIQDVSVRAFQSKRLTRTLLYHFQDGAVFVGQDSNGIYQTAALKTDNNVTFFGSGKNKFYKIGATANENSLQLTTDMPMHYPLFTANVVEANGLFNIIAKDYIFSKLPSSFKNIDGTGSTSGSIFSTSLIQSSSTAVIHQIDKMLIFE